MTTASAPSLPPELLRNLDGPCDAFDQAWQQGERPALERYLQAVGEPLRPLLRDELIRVELEWRCRRGEADEELRAEYRSRFPGCAGHLEGWLVEARESARQFGASAPATPCPAAVPTEVPPYPPALGPADTPGGGAPPLGVLGEYELLGRLGGGGMGEVYRARHRRLGRLVALKVLASHRGPSAQAAARFLREMRALGRVEHPHVVEATDAGECAGVVFLVMKLVDGVDLQRLVGERGPLPVAEACELARQAASGLAHLHQRGLVHRDVKPSNLMRAADGAVKLLDLGLARWRSEAGQRAGASDLTGSGLVLGTPDFAPPEQTSNPSGVDGRADLYSLGATLFFLLTGRPPFCQHTGILEKLRAHADEPPPDVRALRPDVPEALAGLVRRLLAKRPADRPGSAAEVEGLLARFAAGGLPTLTLPPVSSPPPRKRRRAVAGLLAGGLGLALLLALVPAAREPQARVPSPPGRGGGAGRPAVGGTQRLGKGPGDGPGRGGKGVSPPVGEPLRVVRLRVKHFANLGGEFDHPTGLLGRDVFAAREGDSVELEAELSRPGYAYLIAFRPDGTEEVCFPEKEGEAPPLTGRPRYPWGSRGDNYGLDEGAGLQAFVVVASSKPLPAYRAWRPGRGQAPWGKHKAPPGVVWLDDGGPVEALTADGRDRWERGRGREVAGKAELVRLTDWLRAAPGVEAVTGVGFAVRAKE